MKHYRPHRFPPLGAAPAGAAGAPLQASIAQGFHQGLDKGYAEGLASGLDEGRERGLAEGRRDGLRHGLEEGRRAAELAFQSLSRPVDAVLEQLHRLHTEYQLAQRKEVVDVVARVARQVIRCELTLQPTQLLTLVDEALAAMPPTREQIEVYLNPDDLQRILELDPARAERWSLLPDSRLQAGECHVRAGDHEADAGCQQRLSACMQQVTSQLLELPADAGGAAAVRTPAVLRQVADEPSHEPVQEAA